MADNKHEMLTCAQCALTHPYRQTKRISDIKAQHDDFAFKAATIREILISAIFIDKPKEMRNSSL